jgi:hypothetical protein
MSQWAFAAESALPRDVRLSPKGIGKAHVGGRVPIGGSGGGDGHLSEAANRPAKTASASVTMRDMISAAGAISLIRPASWP